MKFLLNLLLLLLLKKSLSDELSTTLEPCSKDENNTVFYCDTRDDLTCKDGKCLCPEHYYLNYTTGKCENQQDYVIAHNLDEYRVRPGLYCLADSHCIEGLVCNDFKCTCPQECSYKEEQEVCDCGKEVPVGPIVTGILSGIMITCFWARVIQLTLERFERKKADKTSVVSNTIRPSYPIEPASSPLPQNYSLLTHQTTTQTDLPHSQDNETFPLASQVTKVSSSPSFPSKADAMHS